MSNPQHLMKNSRRKFEEGDEVFAWYKHDRQWYEARIAKRLPEGGFLVDWADGDEHDRHKKASSIMHKYRIPSHTDDQPNHVSTPSERGGESHVRCCSTPPTIADTGRHSTHTPVVVDCKTEELEEEEEGRRRLTFHRRGRPSASTPHIQAIVLDSAETGRHTSQGTESKETVGNEDESEVESTQVTNAVHKLRHRRGLRWADDGEGATLERIEYIETTYGLPTDATERESRAFSQAQKRAKLRQQAVDKGRAHRASDSLCKGGWEGALESAQRLEREFKELGTTTST